MVKEVKMVIFEAKVVRWKLCDYSDVYILVTGDITVTDGNANNRVAFTNCAAFTKCIAHNEQCIMNTLFIMDNAWWMRSWC